jgi:hypothetical protein
MADLGVIGRYPVPLSANSSVAQASSLLDAEGNVKVYPAPITGRHGGFAGLHGIASWCHVRNSRDSTGVLNYRYTSATRQVYGETQLNGTPAVRYVLASCNAVPLMRVQSTPDLIIYDLPPASVELSVFGGPTRRTETWGEVLVPLPSHMTLTGSLDPCTASVAYSSGLTAAGGFGAATWDLYGSLPSGLGFDPATGIISGTTAATGTYGLDIGVTREGVRLWKRVTLVVT